LGLFPSLMKTFGVTLAILMLVGFHQNVLTYWTIFGVAYGLRYYHGYQERKQQALRLELQASELQTQLVEAQLSALNMQLQPHFLFNTLNAIMVLVRQGKASDAEEMLARLSDLLRCVLEDVNAQEVPLRRELEFLQLYLAIEQVRFQDRLRVEVHTEPGVLDAAVPHMALQPIVENAIRHGIGRSSSAGLIAISARRVGGALEIKVEDDGPGLKPAGLKPAAPKQSRGIGLTNTRARLHGLYGDAAVLRLENGQPYGAVATITLPYRLISDDAGLEMMELHAFQGVDSR